MTQGTSDRQIGGTIVADHGVLIGEFNARIFRADGTIEDKGWVRNQLTYYGLNRLANRAILGTGSVANWLAVGTRTTAASLDTSVLSFGEVSRKVSASNVQSREWFALVATWGGQSDTLTGVALDSAAICDHVNSGQGAAWNIVNGLGVTLQQSDVLNLTARIRVGSHDISHST